MGIVFRQSIKNTVVTGSGALLGAAIMWLSTNYIAKRELGFIGTFTGYAITLSQVLLLGLNSTLVVYVHRYANDLPKKKLLITLCLALPGTVLAIVSILYFFLKPWILGHFQPEDQAYMDTYFSWLPGFTVLFIYLVILEQYLGSQMKVAISAFAREVLLRLANIAIILLFASGYIGFSILVKGIILMYLLPVGVMLLLAIRTKGFGFSVIFSDFSNVEYKEILSFSWYHFLFSVSLTFLSYMDALLLPLYDHKGFTAVAVYRNAVFLISFLQIPLKALMPASFTVLAKAFADNDQEKGADLFLRSSVNIFIATMGVGVLLCCNLTNIVSVLKEGYSDIIPLFLILALGAVVNIATGMNDQVLSITNYYKFNFYLSLFLIAGLFVLIRILVPQYGIYGAAWSTTLTIIIFNTIKCVFVWKKLRMLPFSRNTLLVLLAALPAIIAGYFFPHFFDPTRHIYVHAFVDTSLRSLVIIIIYFLMLLWLKPSADLEEYLSSIKKNKRLF